MALKGVGRYTAGAVACFAFGLPVATVDTNIRRVLWRVYRGVERLPWPGGEPAARMYLELAEWALPRQQAYDWQQALMDLGARICLARKPLCERCPLSAQCAAYAETAQVALFPSGEALARLREERAASEDPPQSRRVAESGVSYGVHRCRNDGLRLCPSSRPRATSAGASSDALRELPPGAVLAALGPRIVGLYRRRPALAAQAGAGTRARRPSALDDKDEAIALP